MRNRYTVKKTLGKSTKNKTAKEVLSAMKDILRDISPTKIRKIRADKGSEFLNQWLKKYMKIIIYFFTTNNPPKSNYIERTQRTLKEKLFRTQKLVGWLVVLGLTAL